MEAIPAIDIKGGKCVRLYQGDYGKETIYSESPVEVASRWVAMGASRIHIVDLDGARKGVPVNINVVKNIASAASVQIQLGGGIRTFEDAKKMLSIGVNRIIIGTAAVESPDLVQNMSRELGSETVMVSLDARNGYVTLRGWTEASRHPASELVKRIESLGVQRFVYTDVTRDGTLTSPNFRVIEELAKQTELKMIVAGGISSVSHLLRLSQLGIEGAIIGTAVYTGHIDLREAIDSLSGPRV